MDFSEAIVLCHAAFFFCLELVVCSFTHNCSSFVQNEWKLDIYLKAILLLLGLTKHILGVWGERPEPLCADMSFFKIEAQIATKPIQSISNGFLPFDGPDV